MTTRRALPPTNSVSTPSASSPIDAVQKANSGHPGAPMGAAPMGLCALGQVPQAQSRGHFRGRTAIVSCSPPAMPPCSSTPSSTSPATGHARRYPRVPAVGEQDTRPSGVRPDARRGSDDRPARPGVRTRRRHGLCRTAARGALQPTRPRDRRSLRLRHRFGRRPDGGGSVGGRVVRRDA